MIEQSARRVENHTCPEVTARIRRQTEMRVAFYADHVDEISDRLRELDSEWDIERTLETMSAGVTLFGLTMAIVRSRKWIFLPIMVQGFFLQHALQGWCPPMILLRRLGVRTVGEIEIERYALKAVRGDFQDLPKILREPWNGSGAGGGEEMIEILAENTESQRGRREN